MPTVQELDAACAEIERLFDERWPLLRGWKERHRELVRKLVWNGLLAAEAVRETKK